ncbi:sugar-binding protein [Shewanella sp. D64]|uniref:RHS repeat domain-containing protein n=1 Tax=unclassified Shewanella TaxID=196818 RepID=UPI0022BA1885|nr:MULTISPECIES: sugar-binding protein [unclassified Shewanella]MEC4728630.1 sugar-binding protein [Shewanella sp. D64]MEC4737879.1 sugar-binding protein [Shewanella sp. E94]WBJ93868.1 sugar-binding protein [Shewanella sp. MTB7]
MRLFMWNVRNIFIIKKVMVIALLVFVSLPVFSENDGDDEELNNNEFLNDSFIKKLTPNYGLSFHSSDLMGEKYDIANGLLTFHRSDANIPGNSGLQVAYNTSFTVDRPELTGWREELPRIEYQMVSGDEERYFAEAWKLGSNNRCSGLQNLGRIRASYDDVNGNSTHVSLSGNRYSSGLRLIIPNMISSSLLYPSPNQLEDLPQGTRYSTNNDWVISCFATGGNEGFLATSPEGVKYYLDEYKLSLLNGNTSKFSLPSLGGSSSYYKEKHVLYVSKVEDRFGNVVEYKYNDKKELIKIVSNDGREVTVERPSNSVKLIKSSGKIWRYESDLSYTTKTSLLVVTMPDGRKWDYDLHYVDEPDDQEDSCSSSISPTLEEMNVTHPDGSSATFYFGAREFFRANVKWWFLKSLYDYNDLPDHTCTNNYALVKKTLNVLSDEYVWQYSYSENSGHYRRKTRERFQDLVGDIPSNIDRLLHRTTTVTNPDLSKIVYYVNRDSWSWKEGKIEAVEKLDESNTLVEQVQYEFDAPEFNGYPVNSDFYNNYSKRANGIKTKTTSIYDDDVFVSDVVEFNKFGRPLITSESSTVFSEKKYRKIEYQHDKNNWILNLPIKQYISSTSSFGSPYKETTYNSSLLPYQKKTFGRLVSTNTYHSDGNLKQITYSGLNRFEQYEDYYRGKARKITMPCASTHGCNTVNGSTSNTIIAKIEVNSDSTTKSVTDFNGNKTNYSYNPIGWLTKVDYANGAWSDKIISYAKVTTANDGLNGSDIEIGQLKQTITQSNFEQRVYHDGLLRPTFTRTKDRSDFSTTAYQRNSFDYANRPILQSFPSGNASATAGMVTAYDELGRVDTVTRTSDNAATTHEYLPGNKIKVTDAKGNVTTTRYLAYGSPSFVKPTLIDTPDGDDTSIAYNKFGQVKSITQGTVTEKRLYDGYQQLCKTYRPETGVTAYDYNAQRQLIWRAEGTDGGHDSCAASSVPPSHKVILGYNNLGQLKTENFPDTTPDNTYGYDANGNLASLTSGSGSSAISWSYLYNSLNLIDKETLSIDGKSFVLDWGYNSLGTVSSLKYPSGRTVNYSPNALGQPTKTSEGAVNYASNVKYHPNGQLKQLTYGNGMVRKVALDTTGRIDEISDVNGAAYQLRLDPSYDQNDNLSRLIDWVDRSNDIGNMSYDGLDRLESADGKWGAGSYTYDGLGNIKTRSISGSSITYHYNTLNRLNNLSGAYAYNYTYDTRGSVTHNGRYGLDFNRANQVTRAKGIPYRYDGHNRRVKKNEDHSVYSQAGQLLYRQNANGDKTDTLYLGKQLIAEVEHRGTYTPPPPPALKPSISLIFSGGGGSGGDCPKGTVCQSANPFPPIPPADAYKLSWTTSNADSCTGRVFRNGSLHSTLSGTSNMGIYFENEGAGYEANLTCSSSGGTTTKFAYAGNGDEY